MDVRCVFRYIEGIFIEKNLKLIEIVYTLSLVSVSKVKEIVAVVIELVNSISR